jgi:hypothetical protein
MIRWCGPSTGRRIAATETEADRNLTARRRAERAYFRTADQVAGFAGRMTRIQSHGLDSLSDSKIRGAGLEGQTPIPLE